VSFPLLRTSKDCEVALPDRSRKPRCRSFAADPTILDGVDFKIARGETVGSRRRLSGSGKTTLGRRNAAAHSNPRCGHISFAGAALSTHAGPERLQSHPLTHADDLSEPAVEPQSPAYGDRQHRHAGDSRASGGVRNPAIYALTALERPALFAAPLRTVYPHSFPGGQRHA